MSDVVLTIVADDQASAAFLAASERLATLTTHSRPHNFWDNEPDAVRAVIDLAAMREEPAPDPAHDRVLALLLPDHADTIREMSNNLRWIDRLEWDIPSEVLSDYEAQPVHGASIEDCERLAETLKADALLQAQLIASLVTR